MHKNLKTSVIILVLGLLGLVFSYALDVHLCRTIFSANEFPSISLKWMIKSYVLFISLVMIFYFLGNLLIKNNLIDTRNYSRYELIIIFTFISISSFFLILFIISPRYFHQLRSEDGPIELASAFFLFISSIIFLFLWIEGFFIKLVSKIMHHSLIVLSLVIFLICMEEVSWLQRIADIETPELFKNNAQKEMNFHNFFTILSEYLYYIGSFVFFVLLPFLKLAFNEKIKTNLFFQTIIPQPLFLLLGFVVCVYNFDMWNSILIQLIFFSSLIINLMLIWIQNDKNKIVLYMAIIILFSTQIIFLINPSNYYRAHEIKEFKEFFISFCFLIYSIDVYKKVKGI